MSHLPDCSRGGGIGAGAQLTVYRENTTRALSNPGQWELNSISVHKYGAVAPHRPRGQTVVCLFISLCACLFAGCLPVSLPVCLFAYLFPCLVARRFVYPLLLCMCLPNVLVFFAGIWGCAFISMRVCCCLGGGGRRKRACRCALAPADRTCASGNMHWHPGNPQRPMFS